MKIKQVIILIIVISLNCNGLIINERKPKDDVNQALEILKDVEDTRDKAYDIENKLIVLRDAYNDLHHQIYLCTESQKTIQEWNEVISDLGVLRKYLKSVTELRQEAITTQLCATIDLFLNGLFSAVLDKQTAEDVMFVIDVVSYQTGDAGEIMMNFKKDPSDALSKMIFTDQEKIKKWIEKGGMKILSLIPGISQAKTIFDIFNSAYRYDQEVKSFTKWFINDFSMSKIENKNEQFKLFKEICGLRKKLMDNVMEKFERAQEAVFKLMLKSNKKMTEGKTPQMLMPLSN